MAIPSSKLINAIREAAIRIENSKDYQWGHMGLCNCGFLAQVVTKLSKAQIHSYAMRNCGDWSEQVQDYCPESQMPFDLVISELVNFGLALEDLINLERLADKDVLDINGKNIYLKHNQKPDVVLYMNTWADLLQSRLNHEQQRSELEHMEEIISF
jgi:phosphoribosyl-dephospho-CoA transferase